MTKLKILTAAIVAAVMMFGAQAAQAHCDSIDGPVAKAAQKTLETGNLNPVLAYAPAAAEAEIRAAFEKSRKVRRPTYSKAVGLLLLACSLSL